MVQATGRECTCGTGRYAPCSAPGKGQNTPIRVNVRSGGEAPKGSKRIRKI